MRSSVVNELGQYLNFNPVAKNAMHATDSDGSVRLKKYEYRQTEFMASELVKYELIGSVAVITMDDGKSNVLSPRLIKEVNGALDLASKDHAVVILTGREGVFSAGFDLRVLRRGRPVCD